MVTQEQYDKYRWTLSIEDDEPEKLFEMQRELEKTLKGCPKCGGKASILFCDFGCCLSSVRWIECENCLIYSNDLISDWNDRTSILYSLETGEEYESP